MWPGWREVRVRNASGGTYVGLKGNKSKEFRMALQKEKREKKRIRNTLLFNTWTGQKTSTGSRHARGREKQIMKILYKVRQVHKEQPQR